MIALLNLFCVAEPCSASGWNLDKSHDCSGHRWSQAHLRNDNVDPNDNPDLNLNLKLGPLPIPTWCCWRREAYGGWRSGWKVLLSTLLYLFSSQGSANASGLLPGEGEEVGGVEKFSLHVWSPASPGSSVGTWQFFYTSLGWPLEGQPFHYPQNPPQRHTLPPLTSFLMEKVCVVRWEFSLLLPLPIISFLPFSSLSWMKLLVLLPWSCFSLSPLLCIRNPPEANQHSRFTWHGDCQGLETKGPFLGLILCCVSYIIAPCNQSLHLI